MKLTIYSTQKRNEINNNRHGTNVKNYMVGRILMSHIGKIILKKLIKIGLDEDKKTLIGKKAYETGKCFMG